MESYPYTKPRGVGPVAGSLTPGAEPLHPRSVEHRRRTRPMLLFTNMQSVAPIPAQVSCAWHLRSPDFERVAMHGLWPILTPFCTPFCPILTLTLARCR